MDTNQQVQTQEEKKKSKRKILLNVLYIVFTIGVMVVYGLLNDEVSNLWEVFGSLNLPWLLAAAGCQIIFYFFEGVILYYVTSFVQKGFGLLRSIQVGMIGLYYSALTPFSSGGQPMQVMHMRKDNIEVGTSSAIFTIKFVIFQAVICLYFVLGMVFTGEYFFTSHRTVFYLTLVGFAANFGLMLIGFLALVNPEGMQRIGSKLVHFLARIRILRNPERTENTMKHQLEEFSAAGIYIKKNMKMVINSGIMVFIQMFFNFAVTYCIYRSFGLHEYSFLAVINTQALLFLTVSFVPLPGAALASESGFALFFSMFFKDASTMYLAVMLWRTYTYYANLLIGAGFVVLDSIKSIFMPAKKKLENKADANKKVSTKTE